MPKTVITFGTFDVLHVGHLRILERASALGDRLVVGVSSDALNRSKKAKDAVFGERSRMRLVGSLRVVDDVFLEESLELPSRAERARAGDPGRVDEGQPGDQPPRVSEVEVDPLLIHG